MSTRSFTRASVLALALALFACTAGAPEMTGGSIP